MIIFRSMLFFVFLVLSNKSIAQECEDITNHGAIANSTSHYNANTQIINKVLKKSGCAHVPKGLFWVSVGSGGVVLPSGSVLQGVSSEASMLIAADRVSGSIIKRNPPTKKNSNYITGVTVKDIGVIMNHAPFNNANAEMIGINFSDISGSYISNVYVGNIPWGVAKDTPDVISSWISAKTDLVQGIGILICTKGSSDPVYAGGERNVVTRARVWGAKIGVSIDDNIYCPLSAAHATVISDSDIQSVEYGIAQQSQYTAGVTITSNTIQDFAARGGNSSTLLIAYLIFGFANKIEGGYIEGRSGNPLKTLYLGNFSRGNKIKLGYVSMGSNPDNVSVIDTLASQIRYAGVENKVTGFDISLNKWIDITN